MEIGIGSRVILRRNTDVSRGLINGALGTVVGFNYDIHKYIDQILVQFDNSSKIIPIERMLADYTISNNIYIRREQFPLSCAFSITIHKSQGLTLDSVIVDAGSDCFEAGQIYVALSRCKTFENLYLIELNTSKIYCDTIAVNEYNRLKTEI